MGELIPTEIVLMLALSIATCVLALVACIWSPFVGVIVTFISGVFFGITVEKMRHSPAPEQEEG